MNDGSPLLTVAHRSSLTPLWNPCGRCGHVFCESCCSKFVAPAGRCFSCECKCFPDKEVIALQKGETGFAAHNEVEVKVYRPGMVL
jgi:hypothetical protein